MLSAQTAESVITGRAYMHPDIFLDIIIIIFQNEVIENK